MVGNEKIIITEKVISYLDNLVFVLYEKEYFGFLDSAEQYVINIYDHIHKNIFRSQPYCSPVELRRHGDFYIFYQANKRTTWYIFFEKRENKYIVTHILNNHCEEARFL